ncbi:hypothetical protein P3T22_005823 [Paraburkholderia sp. GAS348]
MHGNTERLSDAIGENAGGSGTMRGDDEQAQ